MAHRGKRGSSSASLSTTSAPSPSSASSTTAPAASPHAPPASVWGKGGFNPLTSPSSHTATTNGVANVDKSKEKAAANTTVSTATSSSNSSSSSSAPITTTASTTTAPPITSATASSPTNATAAAPPTTTPAISAASTSTTSSAPVTTTTTTTATTATPAVPTPTSSLSAICQLGNTVHVTTPLGEKLEGIVYVYDAASNILALELTTPHTTQQPTTTTKDYTLLNTHNLHITLAHKPNTPTPRRTLPPIDHNKLQQRETKALTHRSTEAARINPTASPAAQRLFDALAKLYEARWDGRAIVLLGVLRLEEPYGAEQLSGGSVVQRQRIGKTIEAQREKDGMKEKGK